MPDQPDWDNQFWTQVVTNAGEVIWTKVPKANISSYGPILKVNTPINIEEWKRNQTIEIHWDTKGIPTTGQHVSITLFKEHYHPRTYIRTINPNVPATVSGQTYGSYKWKNVYIDPNLSIDDFYIVRICWLEQSDICGVSEGVARIGMNQAEPTHIPGSTGLIGTSYEWEQINRQVNWEPAEGHWPQSLNHFH